MEDDLELLEAWRRGEREAGAALLDRHFEALDLFFASKVDADVDDLIQRVFLVAVEARDRFRRESKFRTFLFGVARNVLLQHYQRRRNAERREVDLGTMSAVDLGSSPSSGVARREEEGILLRALRHIPVDLQLVIELHYWEGMGAAELATVLDIPVGTAKSRLRRAREALQLAMRRQARNANLLQSTLDNFDRWCASVKEALQEGSPAPGGDDSAG